MCKEVEALKVRTFRQCQSWPQLLGGFLPQRTRSRESTMEGHWWPWREMLGNRTLKKRSTFTFFLTVYIKRALIGRVPFATFPQLKTNDLYLSCQPWKRSTFQKCLGKPSWEKSAVFFNIVEKAFDPPPPISLNIMWWIFFEGILTKVRKRLLQQLSTK